MLTQTAAVRSEAFRVVPPGPRMPPMSRSVFGSSCEASSLDETMRLVGAAMSYPRNTEIFSEDEPADFVYKVVRGGVRTYKILSDGRRQIGSFYLPGDIFGLQFGDEYTLSAEAITDTKVLVVKRSAFNALAAGNRSIARPDRSSTRCGPSPALPGFRSPSSGSASAKCSRSSSSPTARCFRSC